MNRHAKSPQEFMKWFENLNLEACRVAGSHADRHSTSRSVITSLMDDRGINLPRHIEEMRGTHRGESIEACSIPE